MSEVWKLVPRYNNKYEASSNGRVRKTADLKILKTNGKIRGRRIVALNSKTYLLHRIIATAFHGIPPKGLQVNHKDGDKLNNKPGNLEWVTGKQNSDHATANGLRARGERTNTAKLTSKKVIQIRRIHATGKFLIKEIAKKYNISAHQAGTIISKKQWRHV